MIFSISTRTFTPSSPTDAFFRAALFVGVPGFHAEDLEEAFQYEVLKMLKKEGKINEAIIENMLSRRHTGFHVHVGGRIWPEDETILGRLAQYIVRAGFSRQRMKYVLAEISNDGVAKVVYKSRDGRTEKSEFLS